MSLATVHIVEVPPRRPGDARRRYRVTLARPVMLVSSIQRINWRDQPVGPPVNVHGALGRKIERLVHP